MKTIRDELKKLEREHFVRIRKVRLTHKVVVYSVFDMYLKQHHTIIFTLEEIGKQKDAIGYLLKYIEPLCGVCEFDRKYENKGKYLDDLQMDKTIDYGDEYD